MRITSEGPGALLRAAMIPVPARLRGAYQSWGRVTGMPGDTPIPAPRPAAVYQDRGFNTCRRRSCDAPELWTPGVYWQPEPASRFPGATESDNQMPIPAESPNIRPWNASRRATQLRQRQVPWPYTAPSYPARW